MTKVEWYGPAQVARQFGLMQMVPLLPLTSLNSDLSSRIDLNSSHGQMVPSAEGNYREQLARFPNIIGSLELDAGHNASFSVWWDFYAISQFDLSSDQMIDILRLPRSGSRIPLALCSNTPALGVHLADVGQPSMPVVASEASTSSTLPEVLVVSESQTQVSYSTLVLVSGALTFFPFQVVGSLDAAENDFSSLTAYLEDMSPLHSRVPDVHNPFLEALRKSLDALADETFALHLKDLIDAVAATELTPLPFLSCIATKRGFLH